jgi:CheY-like chemotaxis protein
VNEAAPSKPVMVVEDDAGLRACVVDFLTDEGYSPVGARNGSEALHLLRNEHVTPVVILLDLMMPVMSGWEFRKEQLADASISSIPVIVMTAIEPQGIHADALVRKPFNVDELLHTISRVAH